MLRSGKKRGLPPGTLVHVGKQSTEKIKMSYFLYDKESLKEEPVQDIDSFFKIKNNKQVFWINIDGIHQTEIIESIGSHYKIHLLLLEDIVHTGQRPKIEDTGDTLFITLQMLTFDDKTAEVLHEQVSLILTQNTVITFQEREGDVFEPIRDRIRTDKGRIRSMEADYLLYALLDAIVDYYFVVLDKIGEKIDILEEEIESNLTQDTQRNIYKLKREMIFLRKSVWPLREVISALERSGSTLIKKDTIVFIKDLYDHTIQVMDAIDTFRDMLSGMLDTSLSIMSNRMNEVMKVLTIIATLFIPLTFMAGVYGMNFEWMPELKMKWAYPGLWIMMLTVAISLLFYFRKKKWL